MKTLESLIQSGQIGQGKIVFIRSDLNVPISDGGDAITDDTRIRASLSAIHMALQAGAFVRVTSHLGRPKEGQFDAKLSLGLVAKRLQELLGSPVTLIKDWHQVPAPKAGEVQVLENCRFNVGEKKNDEAWSQTIAKLCDVFVMDAFGTAHRAEATTHGIARFAPIACAGPLLAAEVSALEKALAHPKKPLLAIVGGSKVSTKLEVLQNLANSVDRLIVSGGIANTLLMAQGINVGKSLVEADQLETARALMAQCEKRGATVLMPTDVVCATTFSANATATTKSLAQVTADDMILDFGPNSMNAISQAIHSAGTIIWNGPIGVFEFPAFASGTKALAAAIAQSTKSGQAFSLAGGGDTITAINQFGVTEDISYISTGGGAFLEYLGGLKLPGVEVLKSR